MSPLGSRVSSPGAVRDHLHRAGMRWTPQRRLLMEVLEDTDGHITGSELVERLREVDPDTTPSTVYRTLRVLEDIGVVQHAHGRDGREEFHVRPAEAHGHLHCSSCGQSWEISGNDAAATIRAFRDDLGFAIDLSHLSIGGTCARCQAAAVPNP